MVLLNQIGKGIETEPVEQTQSVDPARQACELQGGQWDAVNSVCIFPKDPITEAGEKKRAEEAVATSDVRLPTSVDAASVSPNENIITDIEGNQRIQTRADVKASQQRAEFAQTLEGGISAAQAIAAQRQQREDAQAGEELAAGVGEFDQQGITPTGIDVNESVRVGLVDSIPRALQLAGGAAVAGATAGLATGGAASLPLAGLAAGVTFVGSIASSMKSNMASQRRDTTIAQQRVLDEGKQTMKDWSSLAETDPANKAEYLAEYNKVSAQIDQAYRQMKLDTSMDAAKFETALPNLAEFESFYAAGGERDTLDIEMRNALIAQSAPEYKLLELGSRRGAYEK